MSLKRYVIVSTFSVKRLSSSVSLSFSVSLFLSVSFSKCLFSSLSLSVIVSFHHCIGLSLTRGVFLSQCLSPSLPTSLLHSFSSSLCLFFVSHSCSLIVCLSFVCLSCSFLVSSLFLSFSLFFLFLFPLKISVSHCLSYWPSLVSHWPSLCLTSSVSLPFSFPHFISLSLAFGFFPLTSPCLSLSIGLSLHLFTHIIVLCLINVKLFIVADN